MRIILATQFKNESTRVVEWLEYYRDRGITDFLLCDDHSTDDTVSKIQGVSGINVKVFPSLYPPNQFYNSKDTDLYKFDTKYIYSQHGNFKNIFEYACTNFEKNSVLGFFDFDEFIFTNSNESLVDIIARKIKPYLVMSISGFDVDSRLFNVDNGGIVDQTTRSMSVENRALCTQKTTVKSFINLSHNLLPFAFTVPIDEVGSGIHYSGLPIRAVSSRLKCIRKSIKNTILVFLGRESKWYFTHENDWVPQHPFDFYRLGNLWVRVDPFSLSFLHYRSPAYFLDKNGYLFNYDYDLNAIYRKSNEMKKLISSKSSPSDEASIPDEIKVLDIYKDYLNSPYLSYKHVKYFPVYQEVFEKYKNKKITFVEIGVLNGGSLFMWRDFFGPDARIIGIDLNPEAKRWEADGFEIYIGNQANPLFWIDFFNKVGPVDLVLDDGGHSNEQQIITTKHCLPQINDGGVLMIEDIHTSFMKVFGNPSPFSFANYSKIFIDLINTQFPLVPKSGNPLSKIVNSIQFHESIVTFYVNRAKSFENFTTENNGISFQAVDYVSHESYAIKFNTKLSKYFRLIGIKFSAQSFLLSIENYLTKLRLKKYFSSEWKGYE